MPSATDDFTAIRHNTASHRFERDLGGQIAFAEYRLSPGTISFFHTVTPPAFRGRGIAATVVRAGLEYAKAEGLRVAPMCWYVADYIRAHPEYQHLLARPPN